jgi:hypothetical protein
MPNPLMSKKSALDKTFNLCPVFNQTVERYITKVDTPRLSFHHLQKKNSAGPKNGRPEFGPATDSVFFVPSCLRGFF